MSFLFAHHGARVGAFPSTGINCLRQTARWHLQQRRAVSISSAIHKGLHKDDTRRERRPPNRPRDRFEDADRGRRDGGMKRNDYGRQRAQWSSPRNDESAQDYEPTRQRASNRFEERNARDDRQRERLDRKQVEKPAYPLSIPHTTAASQFLYGYSTVYAALRAGRRRCYKLYLHTRGATRDGSAGDDKYKLQKLASAAKIQIVQCGDGDTRLLDKMSEGRPHNVCCA